MTAHRSYRESVEDWYAAMTPEQLAAYQAAYRDELEGARRLYERMAAKETHRAILLNAANILQTRGMPGDTHLATTLRCAADAFPWRYGAVSPDVDDVMTGLVRTADEIVEQSRG